MGEGTSRDEVLERYETGGLAGRLPPGEHPAVVVVDLQRGFTDPGCGPGFDLSEVVDHTRSLLDAARRRHAPVFFSTIAFPADQPDPVWLMKMPVLGVLRPGSGLDEIDPRLDRTSNEQIVVKQAASAFCGTDLAEQLRAAGIDSVIVVGATTSGCVRATGVDSCFAGFRTFIVRDCVGDRESLPHDVALLDLHAKYAAVISLDEAMQMLNAA